VLAIGIARMAEMKWWKKTRGQGSGKWVAWINGNELLNRWKWGHG
jgi:hypothetical protein